MTTVHDAPASERQQRIVRTTSAITSAAHLPEAQWAALALALFAAGGLTQIAGASAPVWWTLCLACYAAGGWQPALAGLQAVRERTLDVDLLMIVAAIAAASIGQVLDGALLIVIFATSGALEAFVTRRTADSVNALLTLTPDHATRIKADGGEEEVPVDDLLVGDIVLVRPGDRIGADGIVVEGTSEVDQAQITGEPLPVLKQRGADVFAGTVNGTGTLRVRVEQVASDSTIARIVAMVDEATETKAHKQLFIEKVEQRYSVVVVVATLAILGVPLLFGSGFEEALLRAMTFMIVASPCAVVLATMPPMLAVIANAGRHGVLVKSAVALEHLAGAHVVAFDKTGTLTLGSPVVTEVVPLGDRSAEEVLSLAAAVEHASEHPLARAVTFAARAKGLHWAAATGFAATPGRGVRAEVEGDLIEVLSPAGAGAESLESVRHAEALGHTVAAVTINAEPAALIVFADEIRAEASPTVQRLHTEAGVTTVLLTGDNNAAAATLAAHVGIDDIRSGLLPQDKADTVAEMQHQDRHAVFVGDGINDAPAMATAAIGVTLGRRGSDLAVETADVILVRDDLSTLPTTFALARRAQRVVRANLIFAATVIAVLVTWDLLGTLPLPLGVAGHEGSTVVVALNGLRLLRRSAWERSINKT